MALGNATPCSVSGSYGKTWSAHQPIGFRRKTGDQTFNACGRWRNTHCTKKTNKNWYQTPVRTLARATEMYKHLRLTAAVVCSTTCCEKSVKNKCSSSWYVQLMSFFFFSFFQLLLLSSVLWRNFLQPTCFYPLAVAHMFALRSLASTHNPSANRISSKNMNVWNSATEIVLLAVLNCNWLVHTIP